MNLPETLCNSTIKNVNIATTELEKKIIGDESYKVDFWKYSSIVLQHLNFDGQGQISRPGPKGSLVQKAAKPLGITIDLCH